MSAPLLWEDKGGLGDRSSFTSPPLRIRFYRSQGCKPFSVCNFTCPPVIASHGNKGDICLPYTEAITPQFDSVLTTTNPLQQKSRPVISLSEVRSQWTPPGETDSEYLGRGNPLHCPPQKLALLPLEQVFTWNLKSLEHSTLGQKYNCVNCSTTLQHILQLLAMSARSLAQNSNGFP